MKSITTHAFVILVVSMAVIIFFQFLNYYEANTYRNDIRDAQKSAVIDRQNIKNLITNSSSYDRELGTYLTVLISHSTNQTNTLIKFLTDNFGVNSGYIERENFQYGQANKTFENQEIILKLLGNKTN